MQPQKERELRGEDVRCSKLQSRIEVPARGLHLVSVSHLSRTVTQTVIANKLHSDAYITNDVSRKEVYVSLRHSADRTGGVPGSKDTAHSRLSYSSGHTAEGTSKLQKATERIVVSSDYV